MRDGIAQRNGHHLAAMQEHNSNQLERYAEKRIAELESIPERIRSAADLAELAALEKILNPTKETDQMDDMTPTLDTMPTDTAPPPSPPTMPPTAPTLPVNSFEKVGAVQFPPGTRLGPPTPLPPPENWHLRDFTLMLVKEGHGGAELTLFLRCGRTIAEPALKDAADSERAIRQRITQLVAESDEHRDFQEAERRLAAAVREQGRLQERLKGIDEEMKSAANGSAEELAAAVDAGAIEKVQTDASLKSLGEIIATLETAKREAVARLNATAQAIGRREVQGELDRIGKAEESLFGLCDAASEQLRGIIEQGYLRGVLTGGRWPQFVSESAVSSLLPAPLPPANLVSPWGVQ